MTTRFEGGRDGIPLGPRYTLHAPGFTGTATVYDATDSRSRSSAPALFPGLLETALRDGHLQQLDTISLRLNPGPAGRVGTRMSTSGGEDAISLDMNDLGADVEQVVLSLDESGVATWHFPETDSPADKKRFVIRSPEPVPVSDSDAQDRGLLGVAARVLKTFFYKVTDPVMGVISEHAAHKWESAKRPYGVRSFTPNDYRDPAGSPLAADALRTMGDGRALLFVHGTFSRARNAFGGLPRPAVQALHDRYGGRVFAFDHYTLSDDPLANVREFLARVPDDLGLDVDIVSHSRGGLVARTLVGEHPDLPIDPGRVRVGRVVFVGTPNQGTVLCKPDHITDLLDRYTTALNILPTGPLGDVLDAVIAVVKIVGHGVLTGLDGLAAMDPNGGFISQLSMGNRGSTQYFGLTANYEPADAGLMTFLKDHAMDRVFGDADNDLVVPTDGVAPSDEPVAGSHRYAAAEAIHHGGYFGAPKTETLLLDWLVG